MTKFPGKIVKECNSVAFLEKLEALASRIFQFWPWNLGMECDNR
jgi:hypothetical protein